MICPSCRRENPPENAYCGSCGGALTLREPRAYTPRHLADRILRSRSALEGERKHVTVLFADVKDSTALAERLDPEEWHRILDAFFALLTEGVHRYEGTINQYTGDGIMALFGAPLAHEDHARRGCYAALHIGERLQDLTGELDRRGLPFGVRMGLNSGEVVVGKIGDDLRMDYTAQGAAVALASRIEERAEPGQIWISGPTASLVEGLVSLRDLGTVELRGIREPVPLFELVGMGPSRTRLDASRRRGLSTLVGRESELATLDASLAEAVDGNGRVVGLVGEAGIGKSRLSEEFADRCRGEGLTVYDVACPPHARAVPGLLARVLLRRVFEIADDDGDDIAREKIDHRLARLGLEGEPLLAPIADFLEVSDPRAPPQPAEARTERVIGFIRRLVQTQSASGPAVWLLDDVHWTDAESERVLFEMIDALGWTRTLLVASYRPGHAPAWTELSYFQAVHLAPLGRETGRALVRELLGADPSLAALESLIVERTGGNPFFVEEVVRELAQAGALSGERGSYRLDSPVSGLRIPPSVQSVVAARIDALGEHDKQVLLAASVIGERFEPALLARVAAVQERELALTLRALDQAELIHAGAFAHALVQEVAYQSQLADRRRETHERVARALEDLHADELGKQASLIAHHWESAERSWIGRVWRRRAALRVSNIEVRRPH